VIVALYLTIGSAINIAKGKSNCPDMLPQFAFWKAFFISFIVSDFSPNCCELLTLLLLLLLQEGVYFTANILTCGLCSKTAGPPPSSNYEKL